MRIREAQEKDLPDIVRMIASDEIGKTREDYRIPLPECYADAFREIQNDANSKLLVVCDEDNKVIGTCQITFTRYISRKGALRATIENVHVNDSVQGQGIGSEMIRYAISMAKERGATLVQLTTDKTRKAAHRFYERLGFKATHEGMKLLF